MKLSTHQVRQKYLEFFRAKSHVILPSASLVPENDPTTLFTGSGMQPLVPNLLGEPHPVGDRLVNSQKCFRSQDIEEVGDNRHTTFFEMLGNWSLGDYFKTEQLSWIFSFLVEELGFDPQKLFVTVFAGNAELHLNSDQESVAIWQKLFGGVGIRAEYVAAPQEGIQGGRILAYGDKKNWWSRSGEPDKMPVGEPGGPDSEIFYDFGVDRRLHENSAWAEQACHPNCDCGRFLEIGNSVFMQFHKLDDGSFAPLPKQNVDFGGGLERIVAALNNDPDVFKIDVLFPLIQTLETLSGKSYSDASHDRRSPQFAMRVIADHVRAAVFLASDGVLPGNKAQGYFVRRLLRRSLKYAHQLQLPTGWLIDLVRQIADIYLESYPEIRNQLPNLTSAFQTEQQKFVKVLSKGLKKLEESPKIDIDLAFDLYQSYGFPFELTQELVAERGYDLDEREFQQIRTQHQDKSRTASAGQFKGGLVEHSAMTTAYHTATHLLHAALRQELGASVQQKGSNITEERLRFDYACDAVPTSEQLDLIAAQINAWIVAGLPVTKTIMPKQAALDSGALAFFAEKYPDTVSVYTIGEGDHLISRELCGGPHVSNTKDIPQLEIRSDKGIGQNVRRIYVQVKVTK